MDNKMNRRQYLLGVLATVAAPAAVAEMAADSAAGKDAEGEIKDLKFAHSWTKNLLDEMPGAKDNVDLMRRASSMCWRAKGIDKMIEPIKSAAEFLGCLQMDFGWTLHYDPATDIVICDENNTECLCPVVRAAKGKISPMMCHCTEGMLRRIFEVGLKRKVETEIVSSIIRGGKTCSYKIRILDLSDDEKKLFKKLCVA